MPKFIGMLAISIMIGNLGGLIGWALDLPVEYPFATPAVFVAVGAFCVLINIGTPDGRSSREKNT